MLKVLVVEDEELIRKGIALAVDWAALDCVVVGEAANGREALEAVKRYHPTLIITDLKMPEMDGLEMLAALREQGNPAYVIILTAYDSFAYAQQTQQPEEPFLPGLKKGDKSKYVLQAMDYISRHYGDQSISVSSIARELGLSESNLSHLFRKETDYTILNYLTRYRIHRAMKLLRDCRMKVYEVAEQVGYRGITYFSATFKKVAGVSPSEYQDTCR